MSTSRPDRGASGNGTEEENKKGHNLPASEKEGLHAEQDESIPNAPDKRLRKQLTRSEDRFRLLVQAVKEYAIFMLDTEGYIRSWNEGAERIKGYSEDEILGRHFSTFYTESEIEEGRPETGLKKATQNGQWTDEDWRVRKDGTRFWARVTITALFDEEGNLRGFAKVTRDLTERKQREEQLAEAYEKLKETERLKDEFFANVSHELRTPLTLILSPVEDILTEETANGSPENGSLPPHHRRRLETVHNNSIRMLQMVNGLLDFSKLEIGEVEVDREPTDIEGLTRSICQDFLPLSERKELTLEFSPEIEDPIVEMDRYLYERILFNLLSNAVKFTPSGGEVEVRLLQEGERLELAVADTGEGIPEEKLETIFKDFRQVDASSTRRFEGTGLGLPLVKEFAELLKGEVSAESALGRGSTFTVKLHAPAADQPVTSENLQRTHTLAQQYGIANVPEEADPGLTFKEPPSDVQKKDSNGQKRARKEDSPEEDLSEVVLAEDNDGLSTYIEELLIGTCHVHRAKDGVEAQQLIRKVDPELVITDIMMPRKDGIDLCQEVKASPSTAHIPVVMLTALTNRKALLRGWEAGADEYLFKPFHPKELVTRIRTLLRNIERRKEAEKAKKQLERELLQTSERERRRIGQDLHDGLASHMTGLSTLTQGLMSEGERKGEKLTVDAQQLKRISDLAQEGARQARAMARGLNPVKLDRKGLPAALQTLAETQEHRFELTCDFEQEGRLPQLAEEANINLYWIAHEAVHNAIKHGEAGQISIRLLSNPKRVTLEVEDNGSGLPGSPEEVEQGMGLATMRYRADQAGASLSIQNREDGGVLVSCTLQPPSPPEETAA